MTPPRPPGAPPGLTLRPFRGLRYSADAVDDLGAVTSPPYDVLDPDAVLALESAEPHNVVRLILPREEESGPEGRYEHAARTLRSWLNEGVLLVDEEPALYVYEQSRDGLVVQRGLVGALGLRDERDRIVLPHEDVMPGPVADRLELMRALRANVEPILLMYDGDGGATADVVRTAAGTPALLDTTVDRMRHRVWPLTDEETVASVADDLASRQALIADGHHRYAAYRALQAGHTPDQGPWDAGLALLVDLRAYPPSLGAIHRVVAGLHLDRAVEQAAPLFDAVAAGADRPHPGRFLVDDGHGFAVELTPRDADVVAALVAQSHPEPWRRLDAAVLHAVLLDRLWGVDEDRVSYHHTVEQALVRARRDDGVAVRLAPVQARTVLQLAADGVRMPRKSTSFGPKPRTGLVLRSFDHG